MQIRSALEQDEAAIINLWRACGLIVHSNDPVRDFRFVRSKPTSDILAAFDDDGALIGSVATGYDSNRGWLSYVSVAPGLRHKGVGRDLVRAAEQWLAAHGVAKVHLTVRAANAAMVQFYERIGYNVLPSILREKALRQTDCQPD
jgi:ribosomal protein S18 acetylase RimI-like enzyme